MLAPAKLKPLLALEQPWKDGPSQSAGQLGDFFSPEFMNRFDGIINLKALDKTYLLKIVDLMLDDVNTRLSSNGIHIHVTDKVKEKIGGPRLRSKDGGSPTTSYYPRSNRRCHHRLLFGTSERQRAPSSYDLKRSNYRQIRAQGKGRNIKLNPKTDFWASFKILWGRIFILFLV